MFYTGKDSNGLYNHFILFVDDVLSSSTTTILKKLLTFNSNLNSQHARFADSDNLYAVGQFIP